MLRIHGLIVCVFERTGKGHLCRIPSDLGPFVALDRSNTIEPEYNGCYSKQYVVKILSTAKTGKIRFGKIMPLSLEDFFAPLRKAMMNQIAQIDWGDSRNVVDHVRDHHTNIEVDLGGVLYEYSLYLLGDGGVGAYAEGDWFHLQMQKEANFGFTLTELSGPVKIKGLT